MLLQVEQVLDKSQVAQFRAVLDDAPWTDGRVTAGYQSALAKRNQQLPQDSDIARQLGGEIAKALSTNLLFQSATLPAAVYPPMFNKYAGGDDFGTHIDNAIRIAPGSGRRIRTDISATLFLSEPDEYDGGELVIEDAFRGQQVKLAAGDMILYPATTLHKVSPVTRGARIASFFWVQSLVADMGKRAILFDMDIAIQSLRARLGDDSAELIALTGSYHNLLRQWAEP